MPPIDRLRSSIIKLEFGVEFCHHTISSAYGPFEPTTDCSAISNPEDKVLTNVLRAISSIPSLLNAIYSQQTLVNSLHSHRRCSTQTATQKSASPLQIAHKLADTTANIQIFLREVSKSGFTVKNLTNLHVSSSVFVLEDKVRYKQLGNFGK